MKQSPETRLPVPVSMRRRVLEYAALTAWYAALRVPFLTSFDMVSHDGTYYIAQARHLLTGSFPPGYPALIAAFSSVIGDGVRAAQAVSSVSGTVATLALFALARRMIPRAAALACAAVFAATPVFVRATLNTMSESAYIAWVLLALLAYADDRRAWAGAALGVAALTRPEAIGIAGVLAGVAAWRGRALRGSLAIGAAFLGVYAVGIAASAAGGHATLVSKWSLLGASARSWQDFDAAVDAAGAAHPSPGAVMAGYAARLPGDVAVLVRHLAGVAVVLALVGVARRRSFVLAALAPLPLVPLFTYRLEPRFIAPFVPVCILYAFVGAFALATARRRRIACAALVAAAALGAFANRDELTRHESAGFEPAREAGLAIRDRVAAGARIADRKPFVAFYAGARYVEVPRGPYHDAIADAFERADYLALMSGVTDFFRPELTPLLYDSDAILGELRFSQFYANDGGVLVYARSDSTDAEGGLRRYVLAPLPPGRPEVTAARSGDGARIAVPGGVDMHALLVYEGGVLVDTLVTRGARVSQPAWSNDGRSVAFVSAEAGNPDVFVVDVKSGEVSRVTTSTARDIDPAWDGDAVVFASDRTGAMELWRARPGSGRAPERVTFNGGNRHPGVSPEGDRLSWVCSAGTVVIRDRAQRVEWYASTPTGVASAPAWSPDGSCVAVAASPHGRSDIYLVRANGTRALRLTAFSSNEGGPDWRPGKAGLAIATDIDGARVVAALSGLAPYLARLEHPPDLRVFTPPNGR